MRSSSQLQKYTIGYNIVIKCFNMMMVLCTLLFHSKSTINTTEDSLDYTEYNLR